MTKTSKPQITPNRLRPTRREALLGTVAAGAAGCAGPQSFSNNNTVSAGQASRLFSHGVASGDPTATAMIIWTRISPPDLTQPSVSVAWEISEAEDFSTLTASAVQATSAASDWTVKVDVTDLKPGQTYFYRFKFGAGENVVTSRSGRCKTLPQGHLRKLRLAVVSCNSWQHGFFNGFDHIARNPEYDAVLHLGDYFYEYGPDGYGGDVGKNIGRLHEPPREVLSLDDYRGRHAQYKTDPALQAMHAIHPMICMWDDHEVANNSWEGGAQNHQLDEGDWGDRRRAAMQAYYEWMPVRDPEPGKTREALFRSYSFGDLATLVTLETRLTARSEQISIENYADELNSQEDAEALKERVLNDPYRYLLGQAQIDFVETALRTSKDSGQPWRVIGNQVLMAKVDIPDLTPFVTEEVIQRIEPDWSGIRPFIETSKYRFPLYLDTWSGYPAARERFYAACERAGATDLVVLTGDAHEFWSNDLYDKSGRKMGVELGTTSITSATVEEYLGDGTKDFALLVTKENNETRYYDPLHKGYIDLTFTHGKGIAEHIAVSTVVNTDYTVETTAVFEFQHKKESVEFTRAKKLGFKEWFLWRQGSKPKK